MEQEFGLITGAQVAALSGSSQRRGGFASYRRKAGKLLGVKRGNAYLYPGFQFDANGHVLDSVSAAIAVASELGVGEDSLAQWFCLRSATLGGSRPVDVIGDPGRVVSALRQRFGVQW